MKKIAVTKRWARARTATYIPSRISHPHKISQDKREPLPYLILHLHMMEWGHKVGWINFVIID